MWLHVMGGPGQSFGDKLQLKSQMGFAVLNVWVKSYRSNRRERTSCSATITIPFLIASSSEFNCQEEVSNLLYLLTFNPVAYNILRIRTLSSWRLIGRAIEFRIQDVICPMNWIMKGVHVVCLPKMNRTCWSLIPVFTVLLCEVLSVLFSVLFTVLHFMHPTLS